MKIKRLFTRNIATGKSVFDLVEWEWRDIESTDANGHPIVLKFEVPKQFSTVAATIAATKYARRSDVPKEAQELFGIDMDNGRENSYKQLAHRLALAWMNWGVKGKYFSVEDGLKYYDEMVYMLLKQKSAPNSPQWFNTGIHAAYGVEKESQGYYRVNPETGKLEETKKSFEFPQPHACFIQSVDDNMFEDNGIWDLMIREGKLFKFGSGSGSNFDNIRGKNEPVSGGGKSSGLLSFLRTIDRSAGSVSSGGITRRAAKMVCLSADHPDIMTFVKWKSIEEDKALALINAGYDGRFDADWENGAYATVSGQNSNNSIRLNNDFMQRVEDNFTNDEWNLTARTTGDVWETIKASDLWKQINYAAWRCADPGLQFDDTINEWHTTPKAGRINASNPCSEYMFLDDTACNLASINLFGFFDVETGMFDVEGFQHAVRLWTITLEISVLMAQFPSQAIAENSYKYRTLGLGHLEGGTVLMTSGIPYDSDLGRNIVGAITAIMTGTAYATSAEMAKELGTFHDFDIHKEDMLRVIRNHRRAAFGASKESDYEGLTITPVELDENITPAYLLTAARDSWDKATMNGSKYGFRNAQTTVLAPTGTIGLLMDAACTGVEPEFSLVKFKKLVGGGYFQFVNPNIEIALKKLGYNEQEIKSIVDYIAETNTIEGSVLKDEHLAVFDCANKQGETGKRFIHHRGHTKMMASAQSFLSGAISKTVNMPEYATEEEIAELHLESWKLGIKAVAIYRDNCKSSQPLNLSNDEKSEDEVIEEAFAEENGFVAVRGTRVRLPKRRHGITHEARIGGQKIFVRTGEYENGELGEIFIDIDREGGTIAGLTDVLGTIMSISLQYGVPVKELTDAMGGHKFEPAGIVQHDNIKMASSIPDLIARLLQMEYLGDYSRIQVKPEYKEVKKAVLPIDKEQDAQIVQAIEEVAAESHVTFAGAGTCTTCGGVTKPNGTCHVCLECGATTGCS